MSQDKKFILFVISPIILALLNNYIVKNKILDLSYNYLNKSSFILLFISIVGCISVAFESLRRKQNIALGIISLLVAIILIGYTIIGYSISNFGF